MPLNPHKGRGAISRRESDSNHRPLELDPDEAVSSGDEIERILEAIATAKQLFDERLETHLPNRNQFQAPGPPQLKLDLGYSRTTGPATVLPNLNGLNESE